MNECNKMTVDIIKKINLSSYALSMFPNTFSPTNDCSSSLSPIPLLAPDPLSTGSHYPLHFNTLIILTSKNKKKFPYVPLPSFYGLEGVTCLHSFLNLLHYGFYLTVLGLMLTMPPQNFFVLKSTRQFLIFMLVTYQL